MKTKRKKAVLIGVLILLAAGVISVYAATNYGSQEDPLITKSYLDTVLKPELQQEMRTEMESALDGLHKSEGSFTLVTLSAGQRLTGTVGTELLPRFGSVFAYAYDPADAALVDTTSGEALETNAELQANHLYMVTIDGNGLTAGGDNTRLLVSGTYTIE